MRLPLEQRRRGAIHPGMLGLRVYTVDMSWPLEPEGLSSAFPDSNPRLTPLRRIGGPVHFETISQNARFRKETILKIATRSA